MALLDLLVEKKIVDQADLPVLKREIHAFGGDVEAALVARKVNSEDILAAKGEYYKLPTRSLEGTDVAFEILKYVPEESALHYKFVPIGMADGFLEIGMVDPDSIEARDALNFIASKLELPYKIFLISGVDFTKVSEAYKGLSGEVTQALTELETELTDDIKGGIKPEKEREELTIDKQKGPPKIETKIIEDAPVTKIVATMLNYATQGGASDIHIEPVGEQVRVRFRVDGVLNTSLVLPMNIHAALVARVKILSNMRLDEKRKPQDGRFSAKIEGRKVDFRVSTFPTYNGEKVEMRILDKEKGVRKLDDFGFSERNLGLIRSAINRPYGLILISGPTGSGKTTTLYAMLNEVDKETQNVLSLEDPIEYNIPGMNQSQVKPEIGYTFANGLRSTLRQDPDIIMVGEIRDKETAQLAVQAALTGHLVFSTIHTNNAVGVIPRLIDMGVDPFLIAPTLIISMAQRLVRTLCPGGGKPIPVDDSIKLIIEREFQDLPARYRSTLEMGETIYESSPTPECPKGTSGRAAVFEVLEMNKDIERAILKGTSDTEIKKLAREQGMLTLKEDAIMKSFQRLIPFEEVNKL